MHYCVSTTQWLCERTTMLHYMNTAYLTDNYVVMCVLSIATGFHIQIVYSCVMFMSKYSCNVTLFATALLYIQI